VAAQPIFGKVYQILEVKEFGLGSTHRSPFVGLFFFIGGAQGGEVLLA
jgi:hypothetical protein